MVTLTKKVTEAIQNSPSGIATLETLESLKLSDDFTMKTTLSRLAISNRIIRLKRGVYSTNPMADALVAAQYTFNGYIGFTSALYVHRLISEMPFVVTVVTTNKSDLKVFGPYEFRAVALNGKAIGFENIGNVTVSTKAKTLFDCLYLERYSIERDKLIESYKNTSLDSKEVQEFGSYVKRFIPNKKRSNFDKTIRKIMGKI